jgi:hypothetical protein
VAVVAGGFGGCVVSMLGTDLGFELVEHLDFDVPEACEGAGEKEPLCERPARWLAIPTCCPGPKDFRFLSCDEHRRLILADKGMWRCRFCDRRGPLGEMYRFVPLGGAS